MRFFYVPQVKKYVLIGGLVGFFMPLLTRIFLSSYNYQELLFHHTIRQKLGFPHMEYLTSANIMITATLQILYSVAGALIGMLIFKIRYRHAGYTLLTTQKFRTISGVLIGICLYFFLYADMFNIILPKINDSAFKPIATLLGYAFKPPTFRDDMFRLVPSYPPVQHKPEPYIPPPQTNPPGTNPAPQPQPAPRMPTPSEIVGALNSYRAKNGRPVLIQDDYLMSYAQQRTDTYVSQGGLDNHDQFFKDLQGNQFTSRGYYSLGENSSYSGTMTAEQLIETFYKSSSGHDENQLSTQWTHVGAGVNGSYTNIVFGKK